MRVSFRYRKESPATSTTAFLLPLSGMVLEPPSVWPYTCLLICGVYLRCMSAIGSFSVFSPALLMHSAWKWLLTSISASWFLGTLFLLAVICYHFSSLLIDISWTSLSWLLSKKIFAPSAAVCGYLCFQVLNLFLQVGHQLAFWEEHRHSTTHAGNYWPSFYFCLLPPLENAWAPSLGKLLGKFIKLLIFKCISLVELRP